MSQKRRRRRTRSTLSGHGCWPYSCLWFADPPSSRLSNQSDLARPIYNFNYAISQPKSRHVNYNKFKLTFPDLHQFSPAISSPQICRRPSKFLPKQTSSEFELFIRNFFVTDAKRSHSMHIGKFYLPPATIIYRNLFRVCFFPVWLKYFSLLVIILIA